MENKKGHWYTDKNGNHYFVEDGQTPQEGWEASKRRKMISGGKYKVSEDGNEYKDVTEDEYNKYEADETDFDETNEDDFGFDEDDGEDNKYISGQIFYTGDHAYKITDVNDEEVEFIDEKGHKQVASLEEFKNTVESDEYNTHGITEEEAKGLGLDTNNWNEVSDSDKQYNIGDKFSVDGREFEVTKVDRNGEHIVGKDTKTGEEYDWTRKSLLENATDDEEEAMNNSGSQDTEEIDALSEIAKQFDVEVKSTPSWQSKYFITANKHSYEDRMKLADKLESLGYEISGDGKGNFYIYNTPNKNATENPDDEEFNKLSDEIGNRKGKVGDRELGRQATKSEQPYKPDNIAKNVARVFLEQKFGYDQDFLNKLTDEDLELAAKFFKKFNIDKVGKK